MMVENEEIMYKSTNPTKNSLHFQSKNIYCTSQSQYVNVYPANVANKVHLCHRSLLMKSLMDRSGAARFQNFFGDNGSGPQKT